MEVSVIIPTFNRAHLISRAVQSVLAQEKVRFEVLVVDDGSTDGTKTVIGALMKADESRRLRYVFQSNQGPSTARNFGIRETTADYVAFLDSDDEWLADKLNVQLGYMEAHRRLLMSQTEEIWIRHGKRVNPMKKHKKYGGSIFERCLPLSIVSPSCVMMRRELFNQVGLFDESLPACEDYDLWLRISARFPIGLVERPYVIRYGGHSDQRSRQFEVMDRFRIQALLNLLRAGFLRPEYLELTVKELKRKAHIVREGAIKRGKTEAAQYYERLVQEVSEFVKKDPSETSLASEGLFEK